MMNDTALNQPPKLHFSGWDKTEPLSGTLPGHTIRLSRAILATTLGKVAMDTQHILIVDDESGGGFSLKRVLEHWNRNYRVSVAHSVEEALGMLNDHPVDLLVTDLYVSGISGLELIRRVRASNPQVRAILVTAYGKESIEAELHNLPIHRCIPKPFLIEDMLSTVQEILTE
jgi:two-component system response regulator (stage 0 sporulation protein F)